MRDYAVNARISSEAGRRLKQIADNKRQSFGEILDALILAVPLAATDWEIVTGDLQERIAALEAKAGISAPEKPLEEPPQVEVKHETRGHSEITQDEIEAMRKEVKTFVVKIPRPTLEEISQFFWNEHHLGQFSNGVPVPMTKAAVSAFLTRLSLKANWDKLPRGKKK